MNANVKDCSPGHTIGRAAALGVSVILAGLLSTSSGAVAQEATGKSFVETFDTLSGSRWFVSDGWDNGKHQNCTWSKEHDRKGQGHAPVLR